MVFIVSCAAYGIVTAASVTGVIVIEAVVEVFFTG